MSRMPTSLSTTPLRSSARSNQISASKSSKLWISALTLVSFFSSCVPLGEVFVLMTRLLLDFNAVEAVVDATHRYKEIFYNAD